MMKKLAIGIDIGGTRTKIGLVDLQGGAVVASAVLQTERDSAINFLRQLESVVQDFEQTSVSRKEKIAGIGFGVPGFVREDGQVVTTYGFLAFMENYPLKAIIERHFSLPCLIDNDARVVSLGEALYGQGRGSKRVLTLTLGTGVGFGFVVNGRFTESLPLAHMGGHMKIREAEKTCYCGKTGCLEDLVSAAGISWAAAVKGFDKTVSAEAVFAAAANGHPGAICVVNQTVDYLHTAIHNYINLFAPDMIVLGGGIAKGLAPYLEQIKGEHYLSPFPDYQYRLTISSLGELAGMLGSAALFN